MKKQNINYSREYSPSYYEKLINLPFNKDGYIPSMYEKEIKKEELMIKEIQNQRKFNLK